jgi:hypothetical protein
MTLAGGTAVGATPGDALASKAVAAGGGDDYHAAARCKRGQRDGHASAEIWSPKDRGIAVEKWWKCDGHGGYNGKLRWWGTEDGASAEMRINWESGRRTQKHMTLGKVYTYKGARSVYIRACDSSGCGGWW